MKHKMLSVVKMRIAWYTLKNANRSLKALGQWS